MEEIISKAATLLEALPYMQRFRGEIFVIKYGGAAMDDEHVVERFDIFAEEAHDSLRWRDAESQRQWLGLVPCK